MLVFHFIMKKNVFYVIKIPNLANPKTQTLNFETLPCGFGWRGYNPKNTPYWVI